MIDYASYLLFKFVGFMVRIVPPQASLFVGRRIGDLMYCFDVKHRAIAYANMKAALPDVAPGKLLKKRVRKFYRTFGQNLIEVFFIPRVDKHYLRKYVIFEGLEHIAASFKKGKGMILLGVHAGSWELSNILCANLGVPFSMFVRDQGKFPRLEALLNSYRTQKGCKLISRHDEMRQLLQALKNNEAVGMTVDQGGKAGVGAQFLGKESSMAYGAIKLALKYDTAVLPVFFNRIRGPYIKIIIEKPLALAKSSDLQDDIRRNLQALIPIYEKHIRNAPQEYLWTYKIWKYGTQREVLILNDGKAGHLRQSEAVAKIISDSCQARKMTASVRTITVDFKSRCASRIAALCGLLSGKYLCQGCLRCARACLRDATWKELSNVSPDIVVSCGSGLSPINYLIARENAARAITILKPSILGFRRFDAVIIPAHDRPKKRRNVVVTEGALNLIDEEYLHRCAAGIAKHVSGSQPLRAAIGLIIGGDTKDFSLGPSQILAVIEQVKRAAQNVGADILVTTSRRTAQAAAGIVKEQFLRCPACRLLVIANEKNIPEAIGGILGVSKIIVCSPESISMISEAINSRKKVFVFKASGLSGKHRMFLEHCVRAGYISFLETEQLAEFITRDWPAPQPHKPLEDAQVVRAAVDKLL